MSLRGPVLNPYGEARSAEFDGMGWDGTREAKFHVFSNDMKFHETLKTKFHNISQNFTIFHKVSQTRATLRKLFFRTFAVPDFEKT